MDWMEQNIIHSVYKKKHALWFATVCQVKVSVANATAIRYLTDF